MPDNTRYNSVAHSVAIWMRDSTPLAAAAGLYKQALKSDHAGTRADYKAAAEQIIAACGSCTTGGERLDLIDHTLALLDSIEASRRALAETKPTRPPGLPVPMGLETGA